MTLSLEERETHVYVSAVGDWVTIDTSILKDLRALSKDDRFERIGGGVKDGTPWGLFRVSAKDWNPVTGAKRKRNLSEAERAEIGERLARSRREAS